MNIEPKISVIVPVYNVEKYLNRCIDSILAQTFKDFEVLLIDDGSTDQSGKICDEYAEKDERVRVFHKKNGGVASARQLGTEKARGEYSIHTDGDDWIEAMMLEQMYNAITNNKSDILIADFFIDAKGKSKYTEQQSISMKPLDVLRNILCGQLMGCLWNKLIRHSLYKTYDIYFIENINYYEDVLVLAQLLQNDIKITFLHEAFYHYDQTNTQSITRHYTRSTYVMNMQYIEVLRKMLSDRIFGKIIDNISFAFMRGAFHRNLISRAEFYEKVPSFLMIIKSPGIRLNICLLVAKLGLYKLALFLNDILYANRKI